MTGLLAALRGLLHRGGISLNILLVAVAAVTASMLLVRSVQPDLLREAEP
jgi:hypothetical protein